LNEKDDLVFTLRFTYLFQTAHVNKNIIPILNTISNTIENKLSPRYGRRPRYTRIVSNTYEKPTMTNEKNAKANDRNTKGSA
jgi:hypothetical protein